MNERYENTRALKGGEFARHERSKIKLLAISMFKYGLTLLLVDSLLLYFFFNSITLVIAGLIAMIFYSQALSDVDEQYEQQQEEKELHREQREATHFAAATRHEFAGFEQVLSLTRQEARAQDLM